MLRTDKIYTTLIIFNLLLSYVSFSQIQVEDIAFMDHIGDTATNAGGFYTRILRNVKTDGTQEIVEYRNKSNHMETKYYARFDTLKRLVYLNYISKRSSVDGGDGNGIYKYKYNQGGIVISKEVYERIWFKYKFIYAIIYDPSTGKYEQINAD